MYHLYQGVFVLMAVGLLSIGTGFFMHLVQPYDLIFRWKLIFEEGGEIFDLWKTPPVDLYIKIYLFNITNAENYLSGTDEKIEIEEVGPYVYKELLTHENITFNDNGTLSTIPRHPLVWQAEMSEGHTEDDIFMLPNIALLSIAQVAADKSYFFRLPINVVIRQTNEQPIVRQTAKEFMFGYETTLTTLGNTLLPNWISFDKVGLIDRMYDFEDDFETFYTGHTDNTLSGLYDTYNGSPNLKQWDGEHCSNIRNASDGTKFKSFVEDDEQLLFFRKSMCRPQRMVQVEQGLSVDGLGATKFVFEENALDNGIEDERNKCFCRLGNCLQLGLIDVTDCYYGFPIALSYPHFMEADPKLREDVIGSTPNASKHSSHFMINPISGMPLELSVKFQINMAMRDVSSMANCERFSNIVVPTLWFEITMPGLPQSLLNRMWLYLNILPALDTALYYGSFFCGIILLLVAVTRTALTLSTAVTSSHKVSRRRKSNYNSNIDLAERQSLSSFHSKEMEQIKKKSDKQYFIVKISSDNEDDEENGSLSNGSNYNADDYDGNNSDGSYNELKIINNKNNMKNSQSSSGDASSSSGVYSAKDSPTPSIYADALTNIPLRIVESNEEIDIYDTTLPTGNRPTTTDKLSASLSNIQDKFKK